MAGQGFDSYADDVPDAIREVRIDLRSTLSQDENGDWVVETKVAKYTITPMNTTTGRDTDKSRGNLTDSAIAAIINTTSITIANLNTWAGELRTEAENRVLPA